MILKKDSDHALTVNPKRVLTAAEFQGLAQAPAEAEWFANIGNAQTRPFSYQYQELTPLLTALGRKGSVDLVTGT